MPRSEHAQGGGERARDEGLRLLLALHVLSMAGRNDSVDADALREQFDGSWSGLKNADRRFLQDRSADLQTLEPDYEAPQQDVQTTADFSARLRQAYEEGQWELVLDILRTEPASIPSDGVAYMRARALQHLNLPQFAVRFFERAWNLDRNNVNYEVMYWEALAAAGQPEEALARAERALEAGGPSRLRLRAAGVLFRSARQLPPEKQRAIHNRLIDALSEALEEDESLAPSERLPSVTLAGYLELALSYVHLGRLNEARETFERALRYAPNDPNVLTSFALFKYEQKEHDAVDYFLRAARKGTPLAPPYTFLAHWSLTHERYQEAIEYIDEALQRAKAQPVIADLLEWKAIALARLEAGRETVEGLFKAARTFAPTNQRIQRNLQLLRDFHGEQGQALQALVEAPSFRAPEDELGDVLQALAA